MDNNLFVNPESRNPSHGKHHETAKPTFTSVAQPGQQKETPHETITNIIGNASILIKQPAEAPKDANFVKINISNYIINTNDPVELPPSN
jgi:hypothetical protein